MNLTWICNLCLILCWLVIFLHLYERILCAWGRVQNHLGKLRLVFKAEGLIFRPVIKVGEMM